MKVSFDVDNTEGKVEVFTTRPDTIYGASFLVLSPEHALVNSITTDEYKEKVKAYQTEASKKSDLERTDLAKDKSGVFTGAYATNLLSGEKVQIWIADYVLSTYGTGAIMAVPAHDDRDYEFAKSLICQSLKSSKVEMLKKQHTLVKVNILILVNLMV